jgi:very-short-patch-repair endonuclease/DNA polymerase III delta prime subunit
VIETAGDANGSDHKVDRNDDGQIALRIGEWQKRLLQLDQRNTLLYFKPGRTAVGIVGVAPDNLDRRLQRSRKGLSFPYAERRRSPRGGVEQVPGGDDEGATAADDGPRIIEGELRTDCDPLDLQRRLRNLHRRDREWEEEQGLNILFLAAGFIDWIDAGGEPTRSPLLLIPCDLERDSPRDPFRLCREDDDAVVNPTLRHQLSELGIELPEFGDESSDGDESIEAYVDAVGQLVFEKPGWTVDAGLVLSGFTFSKLAMYEDLDRMRQYGVQSDLTRQLAGGASSEDDSSVPSAMPSTDDLAGGRLDELLDIRDQHAVLPADFSQLRAIQQARSGANLVIHGPPGTGKSQTIANLIATLLADGKRVLFVSEKMAALDVVKRRLEQCGLGTFCLDLHSERGRKREVYEQLRTALADDRGRIAPSVPLDELIESRNHLNRVVRLLHERREPLEMSVYQVQGRLAPLQDVPRCEDIHVPRAPELDQDWLRQTLRLSERIARRPSEFSAHDTSRWLPLRTPQSSLQLAELIHEDMAAVQAAVADLREATKAHADWLGLQVIESADGAVEMIQLLELLGRAPTVPSAWLERGAVVRLRRLVTAQAEQQQHRRQLKERLQAWFGKELPSFDYRALAASSKLSAAEQEAIEAAAGKGWGRLLGADPEECFSAADTIAQAVKELMDAARSTSELLGQEPQATLGEVERSLSLAKRILALEPVPERWLIASEAEALERQSANARALLDELTQAEERLHERYSDSLTNLVNEDMLIRYRTDHQSLWRRMLSGTFRRDQRVLRGQLKTPAQLSLDDALAAVEQALEVRHLREGWQGTAEELADALGKRFKDKETDWGGVSADLSEASSLTAEWHGDTSALRELLAAGADGRRRQGLAQSLPQLSDAADRFRRAGEDLGDTRLTAPDRELAAVADTLARALEPLRCVGSATSEMYQRLVRPIAHYHQLTEIIEDGVQLLKATDEDERLAPDLSADFGSHFERENTDWSEVGRALDWMDRFLAMAHGRPSTTLRRHATDPKSEEEYGRRERAARDGLLAFRTSLGRLDTRFDHPKTAWGSWDAPPFEDLESWALDLSAHVAEASSWAEYREAAAALEEQLGKGAVSALRKQSERAEQVPGIVQRRIYSSWLEEIYAEEPALREFSRLDHEEVRTRFRRLDQALPLAARQRVRERVFARYPEQDATRLQAGQLATLQGELSKRRRQMSVRNLIARIPNLLPMLKPCFLMSPLAVSQYLSSGILASERIEFDTVIFDEASQVWPEDALPAVERARQVIVAGDRHQLPPSDFFRSTTTEDDDGHNEEDDAEDSFEGRESILDVMVGQLGRNVAESLLSVHYRSRCESLIRFSNRAFYDNRLLTFPGPTPDEVCVRSVYLEDATYDAGGSRTNRVEAERVTETVFELMETTPPAETIGVVALSRAQADLIENLIEERRMIDRHLDDRFREDLDEHFFVKNLENVQGDERDHMILSIGYGPTPAGAVPNRFGPINREGGERRLNVAVTRARQSMTVVHSIRPEDITSTAAGARQLRRYLEFVRNPALAFEAEVTGTGEPESPFEEAILAALRSRGHRVESQVGVSGYRIDLAVRSEDGDRFDLGIECDGATYHSSPTARDRDWLRQQVLEGLGWRIHRVWSTAWIRSPETELAAIEASLEAARTTAPEIAPAADQVVESIQAEPQPEAEAQVSLPDVRRQPATPVMLFDEYPRFEGNEAVKDPMAVPRHYLAKLVERIVAVEEPIHFETVIERLRSVLQFGRAGSNIRKRLEQARDRAIRDGTVVADGSGFLRARDNTAMPTPRRDGSRRINRIADAELDAGLLTVARATFGATQDELVRETARQFGYRRTGADIAAKLGQRIEHLRETGQLSEQGGTLVASRDKDASGSDTLP